MSILSAPFFMLPCLSDSRMMALYGKIMGEWKPISHQCSHPKEWEHHWLHAQFEIYLASRGEFALMIEENGYRFQGISGLTSDSLELPPGELYGISYWHWRLHE